MKILVLLVVLSAAAMFPQQVIDKIVAVVDNEIILQSELDFQTNLVAAQRKIDPKASGLKEQILNALIEEKLAYAQANFDSIIVSEDEINNRIDYQIQMMSQQYGSRDKIEQLYGMSIEKIKRELRDDVRKSIMVQRLQEKNFAYVEATRREVEDFFNLYKDSIGTIPEKVTIAHIYRNPKTTDKVKAESREFARSLLDSIKSGSDFAELARKYSEDPGSAVQGGDLGFVKRGVFYPEFETAAFALEPGELSGIVETPVGFHIIEMIEKRGETIKTRHILVKMKADEAADLRTIEFLSGVRDSIISGHASFESFARKYSEDNETVKFGGELGTFYLTQLDKNLLDAVSKLKSGDISFPRRIEFGGAGNYGYHLVYLKSRIPQHAPNLDTDYAELKRLADENKKEREYRKWIESLKNKIFWEIRI
jgi:peptidyl-prolyl cis-trans isomerase SurA